MFQAKLFILDNINAVKITRNAQWCYLDGEALINTHLLGRLKYINSLKI